MSSSAADNRHAVVIEEFKPLRTNSLRGFARVRLPSGMILHGVTIHAGTDAKVWASPPSKVMLDREGHALRDGEGKIRYAPCVAFANKEQRERFSQVVVDAVRATNPEALS